VHRDPIEASYDPTSYVLDSLCNTRPPTAVGPRRACVLSVRLLPGSKRISRSRLCTSPPSLPHRTALILSYSTGYEQAESKATRLLIVLIAVLHAGLALTFKVLFFSYYVVKAIGPEVTIPGTNSTVVVT
jgi:hypothetical protein